MLLADQLPGSLSGLFRLMLISVPYTVQDPCLEMVPPTVAGALLHQ